MKAQLRQKIFGDSTGLYSVSENEARHYIKLEPSMLSTHQRNEEVYLEMLRAEDVEGVAEDETDLEVEKEITIDLVPTPYKGVIYPAFKEKMHKI